MVETNRVARLHNKRRTEGNRIGAEQNRCRREHTGAEHVHWLTLVWLVPNVASMERALL